MTAPPSRAAVTTVVPTHNRRSVLPITLRSVLAQQDVELEVVVVDDGSSDGTGGWLEEHDDARLRVVRHDEPRGVAAARAAGVEATTTPYVAFCDDDDVWAPDKLARQFDALEHDPAARWSCTSSMSFVVAGPGEVELVHYQETPTAEEALPRLLGYNAVPGGGSSVLADTALVRDAGGFRTGMAEDWDMWVRLALAAPVAPVARPLCGYRVWRSANSSRSYDLQAMQAGIDAVRDRYADEARDLGVDQRALFEDAHLAKIALRGGLRRESFVRYANLARRDPKKLVWAFAALVSPAAVDRATDHRAARSVPAARRDEVLQWLPPLLFDTPLS